MALHEDVVGSDAGLPRVGELPNDDPWGASRAPREAHSVMRWTWSGGFLGRFPLMRKKGMVASKGKETMNAPNH